MSERPTPETDACIYATRGESIFDLCKRMERERDEARDASEAFSTLAWNLEGKLHRVLKLLDAYDESIKNPSNPHWDAFKKLFNWIGLK